MTCGPHDGITIELPRHGVEVRPLETDLRMRRRHYSRAQFKLQEEAGRLLARYSESKTLAYIKVDGEPAHRMMIPQDGITFERDLNDTVICNLDLLDARKVLAQGSVEKSFKDVDAERIVRYLLEQRHDPEGLIQGYEFVREGDAEITATTSFFFISEPYSLSEAGDDDAEFNPDFDLDPFGLGTRIVDHLGWAERLGAYTFDFEGETILSAFEEAMNQFGLNWWVEDDGTLYIGPDGSRGQILSSRSGGNEVALSRYTVTTNAKVTNAVQLHATVMQREEVTAEDVQSQNRVAKPEKKSTRAIAEAYAPEITGDLMIKESSQSFDSLAELEDAATRHLYQEVMDDTSGSLEINGLASTNIEGIRDLDVGDYFIAGPGIEDDCNREVITGMFLVTSVHHRAGPRKGWQIGVEVTRIPNPERLRSVSTFYDPQTDRNYESLRTYDYPSVT